MLIKTRYGNIHHNIRGSGPPLVLIHGTPFSSLIWTPFRPVLERHFTVYSYDLLGYGQSEMPDTDVSLGIQNEVLCALLEAWELNRPRVIAHDFGGATVLRSIVKNKRSFERLLLMDVVALSPWGSPFVQHVRQHESVFSGIPDYIHQAMVERYIQDALFQELPVSAIAHLVQPWLSPNGKAAFYRQIAQMDTRYTGEVQEQYPNIDLPIHILWGTQDQWIPIEQGRKLQRLLPRSSFKPIPDAGHLVMMDQPLLVLGEMLSFLTS